MMAGMTRIEPLGDAALTVHSERARALRASLEAAPLAGVQETVPGLNVLTVLFDPLRISAPQLSSALRTRLETLDALTLPPAREVTIPVEFGGPDLDWCAGYARLTPDAFLQEFCDTPLEVAFLGFTPGFAFLAGLPPPLRMPRLAAPRERVPAGSVALGGPWAGVYPRETPGGWRLIGYTDARLFDLSRPEPLLWQPGDRVRFRRV